MLADVHQQFAEYFKIPLLTPYAYLLHKRLDEGHICLPLDEQEQWIEELPEWYRKDLASPQKLAALSLVGNADDPIHPFILDGNRLYLQRYYKYESAFLSRIRQFLEDEQASIPARMEALKEQKEFIRTFFPAEQDSNSTEEDKVNWQLAAAISAALQDFTIITGGPGTGKTTTVARLLAILHRLQPDIKVALAAPTGKAAARMAESLKKAETGDSKTQNFLQSLMPSTIHRLLKPKKDSPYFHHNASNPLPCDIVIVDESSMIDVALFSKLLDAVGKGSRIILMGDKDQLASVEAGSFFGDLCSAMPLLNLFSADRGAFINSFMGEEEQIPAANTDEESGRHPLFQHIIELRRSRRFAGNNGIGKWARAIIRNDAEAIQSYLVEKDDPQVTVNEEYDEAIFRQFVEEYSSFIKEPDMRTALKRLNDLRVLCAVREGDAGLYATNKAIEQYLHQRKWINSFAEFYENRPIILTANNYQYSLFNGDTGIIRKDERGTVMAWFEDADGNLKSVLPGYLSGLETAFAMTIHKSQGSEFGAVLVRLPADADVPILTRELLYTAITRAKNKVVIQASASVLEATSARHVSRSSGIASRFLEEMPASALDA